MIDMREPSAELDFAALRRLVSRRWHVVAATTVAGTLLAFGLVTFMPVPYEAAIPLFLSGPPSPAGSGLANSLRTVLANPTLLHQIASQTGAEIDPDDVFVDPVPNTPFVRLRVQASAPEAASKSAELMAAHAVELSHTLRQQRAPEGTGTGKALDAIKAQLTDVEGQLLAFRERSGIEALRREHDLQNERDTLVRRTEAEIEQQQARLKAALAGLAQEQKKSAPERAPAAEAEFARIAAESRAVLTTLTAQRQAVAPADENAKRAAELRRKELELKRLEAEHELIVTTYASELLRSRQNESQSLSAVPLVAVAEPGTPVAEPVKRDRTRITLLAVLLSFLAGVAVMLAIEVLAIPPASTTARS